MTTTIKPSSLLIESDVRQLATLNLQELRDVWIKRFGSTPKLRSIELLRLMLAWRIQAKALGGLDANTKHKLALKGKTAPEGHALGHGAILRRTWQGRTIEVIVETQGFRFEGKTYCSLSAIAEAVTGTRWNGPRFFGLRKERAQ